MSYQQKDLLVGKNKLVTGHQHNQIVSVIYIFNNPKYVLYFQDIFCI